MALRSPLTVQPYDYISDSTGRPLDKGQIYIGVAGQDPEFYQIPIYLDAAMTKPIDQPIRTNDGFVDFAGSLSELYASAEVYSVKVLDNQGRKVIYKAEMMRDNLTNDALQSLNTAIGESQQAAENTLNATVDSITNNAINTVQDAINNTAVEGGVLADTFVTMTANGVGTVPRSLRDVNSDTTNLLNFIPPSEMAAIQNRTSTYDCSAALAAAVSTGKRVVVPTAGTYKFIAGYDGYTDFDVIATTDGVIFDLNDVVAPYAIKNSGSLTKLTTQSNAAITKGSSLTTGLDVTSIKEGDWLCFFNPADSSYSGYRASYKAGEWKQVAYIDGDTVCFTKQFYADYALNTLDIYKMNSVKCHIENIHIIHRNSKSGAIKFSLSSKASDKDMTFDSIAGSFLTYDRCVGHNTTNPNGRNKGTNAGLDYGIVVSNSQHGRVNGGDIYSQRHAVIIGGTNEVCCVPVSDFRCYDAKLTNDPEFTIGAADMHGNTRDSSYERCTISGGSNIGGGDRCYYIDCTIDSNKNGVIGFGREIIGGDFGWFGCRGRATGNPQDAGGRSTFDFGAAGDVYTNKTQTALNINIVDFRFETDTVFAVDNVSFCKVINRGSLYKTNVNIDNITFKMPVRFRNALLIQAVTGAVDSDYIIVDNLKGNAPKQVVIAPTAASKSFTDAPMRLPQITGKLQVTTTALDYVQSLPNTLPFIYPRMPNVQVLLRAPNGVAATDFGGQKTVTVIPIQTATDSIRMRISAPAPFTAGADIEAMYTVGIREC